MPHQFHLFPPRTVLEAFYVSTPPKDWKVYRGYRNGDTPQHFCDFFNNWSDEYMARKSGKTPHQRPDWGTQFINWRPDKSELKAFDKWLTEQPEDAEQALDDMMLSGSRLSVTFSAEIDAFTCALTPRDENDPNHGYTLSLKSGDWKRGVYALAFYCRHVATDGHWSDGEQQGII